MIHVDTYFCDDNKKTLSSLAGDQLVKYLLTENDGFSLKNTGWYADKVCEKVKFYGKVLDLGCGFGLHSLIIKENCHKVDEVKGVDPVDSKLMSANKIKDALQINNVEFVKSVAEKLPFEDAYFDFVYCNESISHMSNVQQALLEIMRVLKNDGTIIISDTEKWNPYALAFVHIMRHVDENYFHINTIKNLMRNAGFNKIERVTGIVAPRNVLRKKADMLWFLFKFIDPKYVLVGKK